MGLNYISFTTRFLFLIFAFTGLAVGSPPADDMSNSNTYDVLGDGHDSVTLAKHCSSVTKQKDAKMKRQACTPELCPPTLKPVCCAGIPEYLGTSIPDCWECRSSVVYCLRDCVGMKLNVCAQIHPNSGNSGVICRKYSVAGISK